MTKSNIINVTEMKPNWISEQWLKMCAFHSAAREARVVSPKFACLRFCNNLIHLSLWRPWSPNKIQKLKHHYKISLYLYHRGICIVTEEKTHVVRHQVHATNTTNKPTTEWVVHLFLSIVTIWNQMELFQDINYHNHNMTSVESCGDSTSCDPYKVKAL